MASSPEAKVSQPELDPAQGGSRDAVHSQLNEREAFKMEIKVLGSGCSKCRTTIGMIERIARSAGVHVSITKVESPEEISETVA